MPAHQVQPHVCGQLPELQEPRLTPPPRLRLWGHRASSCWSPPRRSSPTPGLLTEILEHVNFIVLPLEGHAQDGVLLSPCPSRDLPRPQVDKRESGQAWVDGAPSGRVGLGGQGRQGLTSSPPSRDPLGCSDPSRGCWDPLWGLQSPGRVTGPRGT